MEMSETRPFGRTRLQWEKQIGRLMKCLISSDPSQPDGPGGSNVSTFTDGVGRAVSTVLCAALSTQRLKADQRTVRQITAKVHKNSFSVF